MNLPFASIVIFPPLAVVGVKVTTGDGLVHVFDFVTNALRAPLVANVATLRSYC